jgi:hypothetical protein
MPLWNALSSTPVRMPACARTPDSHPQRDPPPALHSAPTLRTPRLGLLALQVGRSLRADDREHVGKLLGTRAPFTGDDAPGVAYFKAGQVRLAPPAPCHRRGLCGWSRLCSLALRQVLERCSLRAANVLVRDLPCDSHPMSSSPTPLLYPPAANAAIKSPNALTRSCDPRAVSTAPAALAYARAQDTHWCEKALEQGYDSIQVATSNHVLQGDVLSRSELILCSGACATTPDVCGACPPQPIELRTGVRADRPCECDPRLPLINCGGSSPAQAVCALAGQRRPRLLRSLDLTPSRCSHVSTPHARSHPRASPSPARARRSTACGASAPQNSSTARQRRGQLMSTRVCRWQLSPCRASS